MGSNFDHNEGFICLENTDFYSLHCDFIHEQCPTGSCYYYDHVISRKISFNTDLTVFLLFFFLLLFYFFFFLLFFHIYIHFFLHINIHVCSTGKGKHSLNKIVIITGIFYYISFVVSSEKIPFI